MPEKSTVKLPKVLVIPTIPGFNSKYMKANELMIGDWVKTPIELGKVMAITATALPGFQTIEVWHRHRDPDGIKQPADCIGEVGNLQPIPLTPEILEKNGFEKSNQVSDTPPFDEDEEGNKYYSLDKEFWGADGRFWGWWQKDDSLLLPANSLGWITLRYVHELQHALRLCGISLDIKI